MSAYAPYPRSTLLMPSGPEGYHLFIVMTNVCKNDQFLLLPISSIKPKIKYDDTCTFKGGEHEFIKKPSFVAYRFAELRHRNNLQKCVESKVFIPKNDLGDVEFKRICDGVEASDYSRPWVISYFKENCN